ncbi:MAG TPA: imelysin family protein [Polyangiaceae bacterium]|nr:imelysin family protein [Polyangiaceae bacterium]
MKKRLLFLCGPAALGALALGATAASCGGSSSSSPPPTSAAQTQFLQATSQCAVNLYASFAQAAAALSTATATLAAAPSDANREAARAAWVAAIDLWQQAEVFQFGPAAPSTSPGGQGLRDELYAWPLSSRCTVEQALVAQTYADPAAFAADRRASVRGLAAIEYLLYSDDTANACAANADINVNQTWTAIVPELPARRAAYASAAAAEVAAKAQALADAWAPDKGNFAAQLATAGAGSATFASGQLALNAVSDALFYVEIEVKDQKLAIPLALSMSRGCATPVNGICPGTFESPFANRSQRHVRNNLVGFRKLFAGCDDEAGAGVGFDDLLTGSGPAGAQLAAVMTERLDKSFAALDALPEGAMTDAALPAQKAPVTQVFGFVSDVVSQMKSQFLSLLDLELPKRAEGDND